MQIGLLGGSFNPPHLGHLLIAQQVLDFTDLEEIWWLPAYAHTFDKPLAPVSDRVAMAKLLNLPKTKVSTLEIDHQLNGDTINLVPLLKEKYPHDQFTFVMGSDQLPTFQKWGRWEQLIEKLPFLIVPRAGYPLSPLYKNMRVLQNSLFISTNISSSLVRVRIAKGLSIDHLVPETVKAYIATNMLYK